MKKSLIAAVLIPIFADSYRLLNQLQYSISNCTTLDVPTSPDLNAMLIHSVKNCVVKASDILSIVSDEIRNDIKKVFDESEHMNNILMFFEEHRDTIMELCKDVEGLEDIKNVNDLINYLLSNTIFEKMPEGF